METENKYQRGKIYKIISTQTVDIYYGSTIEKTLTNRLSKHRRNYKCWLNGKQCYVTSYEIVKYDDAKIILVENFPCLTKYELVAREQFYIDNNGCVNKRKAYLGLSKEQYYKDHKEEILKYQKQYYKNNKEQREKYDKQYRENNKEKINKQYECPCGGNYTYYHISHHFKTKKHQEYLNKESLS